MKPHDLFMIALGALIVLAFFALNYLLMIIPIPTTNKDAVLLTIGAMIGAFTMIVSYYFGSSLGSKNKDEKNV